MRHWWTHPENGWLRSEMERFSGEQGVIIQREGEWERKIILSVARDQQASGTFCSFPPKKKKRQRFISPFREPEELILYFLCRLFAGQVFPNWIIHPDTSPHKIYPGNTRGLLLRDRQSTISFSLLPDPTQSCGIIFSVVPIRRSADHASQSPAFSNSDFYGCTTLRNKKNGGITRLWRSLFLPRHLAKISFSLWCHYQVSCQPATVEVTARACPPLEGKIIL